MATYSVRFKTETHEREDTLQFKNIKHAQVIDGGHLRLQNAAEEVIAVFAPHEWRHCVRVEEGAK